MRARILASGVLVGLFALLGTFVVAQQDAAEAVVGSQFDAGNIISDEVFYNGNSMTETEIQSFLDAKIGNCQNSLCLNVYRADTPTIAAEEYCSTYVGGPNESAAAIIYKVQRACNISAKVILVTLQKEQGLVTRTAPSDGILRKAMGMGCPDTSVCDSQYYGYFNQVYAAARQLNRYNHGSFTYFKVGQYTNLRWHPNAACGSSPVLIQNRATAALYYYTPYQPNAAALANLGGTGDGCSSYGNRNFWVYFSDWFGSTQSEAGPDAIRAAAAVSASLLGPAESGIISMDYYGGGLGQAFQNGSVYWTAVTGAHVVSGDIRGYYFGKNGAAGPLAWPNSEAANIPQNGGGSGQSFLNGSVYSSPSAGTWSVSGKIKEFYWAQSGSAGTLGWPVSDQSTVVQNGGGIAQAFQAGSVYSQSLGGTYSTWGEIRARYFALDGAAGKLSWPTTSIVSIPQNGSGLGQAFRGGSLYSSPAGGTWEVTGSIRDFYFGYGGAGGQLGWPLAAPVCGLTDGVCSQKFQVGSVISQSSGTRIYSPEIEKAYKDLGGASGKLGKSVSGVIFVPQNGGGLGQAFEGGSIYWKSSIGAFSVSNEIRNAYFARNGSAGPLGWPIGTETCGRADGGCAQPFENGWIYWTPGSAAWVSVPEIAAVHASNSGVLGLSSSEVVSIPQNGGGLGQAFAGGSIYWTSSAGGFAVTGGIRQFYFGLSGSAGSLGWPTAAAQCGLAESACSQSFQKGMIVWSPSSGGRIARPDIEALYATLGGPTGELGTRTSGLVRIPQNGGGVGQAYVSGSIYSSASGTWAVTGAIRDFYFGKSGSAGVLGWPLAGAQCGLPDGGCSQSFQGGIVLWSAALGARLK